MKTPLLYAGHGSSLPGFNAHPKREEIYAVCKKQKPHQQERYRTFSRCPCAPPHEYLHGIYDEADMPYALAHWKAAEKAAE